MNEPSGWSVPLMLAVVPTVALVLHWPLLRELPFFLRAVFGRGGFDDAELRI